MEEQRKTLGDEKGGERLKEITNKNFMEKVRKLRMKDPSGNTVQNTSSLVYDT